MAHRRLRLAPLLVLAAACALAGASRDAGASSLHFEIANPNGVNQFSSYNYICLDCTVEQYAAMVLPADYRKRNVRILVPSTTGGFPATPPAGIPQGLDFVPEIPGDDFFFCCEVLNGSVLGIDSVTGTIFNTALVKRSNVFHYAAGEVVHDVIDPLGNRYALFLIDVGLAETYDLGELDSLGDLPLPPGWSYESRTLTAPLSIPSPGGLASNFGTVSLGVGVLTAWQQYDLPEPSAGLLAASALLGLRLLRRNRRTIG